jgi:hypothetical protein
MKAWIRDNYYMEKIPAKRLKDNALLHIFPVRDDPADSIKSDYTPDLRGLVGVAAVDKEDRIETILWHGEEYEVFSIDLQWENSSDTITPHTDVWRDEQRNREARTGVFTSRKSQMMKPDKCIHPHTQTIEDCWTEERNDAGMNCYECEQCGTLLEKHTSCDVHYDS